MARTISFGKTLMTCALVGGIFTLSACEDFEFSKKPTDEGNPNITDATKGPLKLEERDVQAPEVFENTGKALWDGRPSLGGVWVAHPDANKPERVLITNNANGKSIVGALFNRDRNNPGPDLQLSSDAAAALNISAGSPVKLSVVALRRETVQAEAPKEATSEELEQVKTSELKPVPTPAVVATPEAVAKKAPVKETVATSKKPKAKPVAAKTSKLKNPYAQVGTFGVEANAKAAVKKIENYNLPAKAIKTTVKGKTLWRVIAGPAQTAAEQTKMMEKVQSLGYKDAFLVKG